MPRKLPKPRRWPDGKQAARRAEALRLLETDYDGRMPLRDATVLIAARMGVAPRTVDRWWTSARTAGLLPPRPKGRWKPHG